MNKMKGWIGFAALGFGLVACSDNSVESKNLNVDAKGNLYVTLRDVNGNLLTSADSVNVTLLSVDKKPRRSDSLGTVLYKNLQVGSYQLLVEKTGFASVVCDASISLAATDETPIAADRTLNVLLHKTGAGISGTAVLQNQANINGVETKAAAGSILRLELYPSASGCAFVNNIYTDTVNTDGTYGFADLPERASFEVIPQALTVGSELYTSLAVSQSTGVVGESRKLSQISYSVNSDPFKVVSSNRLNVAIDDSIVVNFSKSVDLSRILRDSIRVSNNVAIVTAWSNDNKTLTVRSATSKWPYGSTFTLYFSVYSVDGIAIGVSSSNALTVNLFTNGDLAPVAGLKAKDQMDTMLNYSSSFVNLIWNKLANAAGYEVYRRYSSDSSYTLLATLTSINDTTYTAAADFFNDVNGKSLTTSYLVVGINSLGRSPFVLDSAKVFFDKVRPTFSLLYPSQSAATATTATGFSATDWVFSSAASAVTAPSSSNLDLTTSANLANLVIDFSEPMDTTVFSDTTNIAQTIAGTTNSSTILRFTKAWSLNDTRLTIKPFVTANQNASDVSLQVNVSFSGVTDKRGNTMANTSNSVGVLFKHVTPAP